jgi:anti-sigma factor (TIGR02949 family)
MLCEDVRHRFGAYLDGEMTGDDRTHLEAHLAGCSECRLELGRMRELGEVLRRDSAPEVPAGFRSRVLAAACEVVGRDRRAAFPAFDLRAWWLCARPALRLAAACAVACGVGIGAFLGSGVAPKEAASADEPGREAVAYAIDYLGAHPSGSLSEAYLQLVSGVTGEEE